MIAVVHGGVEKGLRVEDVKASPTSPGSWIVEC
jgi:hypothetical protein